MSQGVFKIISESTRGEQRGSLFCWTLAAIIYDDADDLDRTIRAELEPAYDNQCGERVVWRVTRIEAVDEAEEVYEHMRHISTARFVTLFTQHFTSMDEHYQFFERPIED